MVWYGLRLVWRRRRGGHGITRRYGLCAVGAGLDGTAVPGVRAGRRLAQGRLARDGYGGAPSSRYAVRWPVRQWSAWPLVPARRPCSRSRRPLVHPRAWLSH